MPPEELELIKAQTIMLKHLAVTLNELNGLLKVIKPAIIKQMELYDAEKN